MTFRTALFVACSALAFAAPQVAAQPISGGATISLNAPGEPIASLDVFYDRLSPYGAWLDEPQLGRVFVPDAAAYIPYRNGHWEYTDAGFTWVSSEPFAWATSHYGRWGYSPTFDRWVWAPDLTWGPAWVEWSETDGDFGWSPIMPDAYVQLGFVSPISAWAFVPAANILATNLTRYFAPANRVVMLQRQGRRLDSYGTIGGARVYVGPTATVLRAHQITVKPSRLDMAKVGRMTAVQSRDAIEHARTNLPKVEQRNRERVQNDPKLKDLAARAAEKQHGQPAKPEQNKPEQARPEQNRPEQARPEQTRPEQTRPEQTRPEQTRPENKPEPTRPEQNKPEQTRPEPTRPETQPQKPEPQKAEPARPQTQPQKAEPQKAEPQKAEPQKPEPQKPEPQRAEPQRAEPQRAEPQKPQPQATREPKQQQSKRPPNDSDH